MQKNQNKIPLNTELEIKPIDKQMRKFELLKDYRCVDGVVIPAGFVTDFASIPRMLWSILPPFGKYGFAALEHDFLYQNVKEKRKLCDKLFWDAMKRHNVNVWKQLVIYYGVRIGGWHIYNRYKKQKEKKQFEEAVLKK